MQQIFTASWRSNLPDAFVKIGISRGTPRRASGYRRMGELEPGPWFRSVGPARYLELYANILQGLDPREIRDRLFSLGQNSVLLCWESACDCHLGRSWCHRHIVAQWLEDHLGIVVAELGHPSLDRFAYLRTLGLRAPSFRGETGQSNPDCFR
jgi:hypothetical protein